jgi:hypothetical protein
MVSIGLLTQRDEAVFTSKSLVNNLGSMQRN